MSNKCASLGLFIGNSIICIIGIILANIKNTNTFNFTGCGVAIAIVFGVFAFISILWLIATFGDSDD